MDTESVLDLHVPVIRLMELCWLCVLNYHTSHVVIISLFTSYYTLYVLFAMLFTVL